MDQRIVDLSARLKRPNRAERRRARHFQLKRDRGVVLWTVFVFADVGCIGFAVSEDPTALVERLEHDVRDAQARGEPVPPGLAISVVPLVFAPGCPLEQLVAVLRLKRDAVHTAQQLAAAGVQITEMPAEILARLHPLASTLAATDTQQ
jgi:hypothetical protein